MQAAARLAKQIVEDLGGTTYAIKKRNKVLYHAFSSFASPLVIALMASLERVAKAAGIRPDNTKTMMVPLLLQTLRNYLQHDAASAFSGPLVRGDVATVRRHLEELKAVPEARAVYIALAKRRREFAGKKSQGDRAGVEMKIHHGGTEITKNSRYKTKLRPSVSPW